MHPCHKSIVTCVHREYRSILDCLCASVGGNLDRMDCPATGSMMKASWILWTLLLEYHFSNVAVLQ